MLYPLPNRAAVLFYEFRFNYWLVELRRVRGLPGSKTTLHIDLRIFPRVLKSRENCAARASRA
jgi:hypothetical protein